MARTRQKERPVAGASCAETSTVAADKSLAPEGSRGKGEGTRKRLPVPNAKPAGGGARSPWQKRRDAWVVKLQPHFAGNESAYFTGTYSEDYGIDHGLMLARNVLKDWLRFLEWANLADREWVIGIETHAFRRVLHFHAIIEGSFTADELRWLHDAWAAERGWAKVLPVLDGCESYVTKYALKGDTDNFEWQLRSL